MKTLDAGRLGLGAACTGAAKELLELSTKYAKERVQFDVPIAQFEAIQFMLAEMAVMIYAMESMVYRTAADYDAGKSISRQAASVKYFCFRVAGQGCGHGRADPWRHGVLAGAADRAVLPGLADQQDLRGDERDSEGGDCEGGVEAERAAGVSRRRVPSENSTGRRGASAPLPFLTGANYPWTFWEGRSNYGCDFGINRWGTHNGVSRQAESVLADFHTMKGMGLDVVRWFVLCDGRAGVRFGPSGEAEGLDGKVAEDLDAAIAAARYSGVRLILVLLDYLWVVHRGAEHSTVDMLIEPLFLPLFRRYGSCPEVVAWELMNEPDWVVEGMSPDSERVMLPLALPSFLDLLRETGRAVHRHTRALYTLGTCRVRHLRVVDDRDRELDLLQVHPYADFLNGAEEDRIAGRHVHLLGVGRPVLVGEYPLGLEESVGYARMARERGYAGALFWSFNPVDKFGLSGPDAVRAAFDESTGGSRSG